MLHRYADAQERRRNLPDPDLPQPIPHRSDRDKHGTVPHLKKPA
jgi:hypothetical protein